MQYVTATGNVNSSNIEDAIRTYDGMTVLVPQFDLTCNPGNGSSPNSNSPAVITAPNYGCPAGSLGGNGSNQWYRIPVFASFLLQQAYVNGSNKAVCDTGNGATSCLVGTFVDFQTSGTVGPGIGGGTTDSGVRGVQLIK